MSIDPDSPLGPPPRKAHLRRGVRNLRRGYRTIFGLLVLVLGGWVAMDAFRWNDLSAMPAGSMLPSASPLCWRSSSGVRSSPLGRELRLAHIGSVVKARILAIGKPRGRRQIVTITYAFQTAAGAAIQADSALPRRFPRIPWSQERSWRCCTTRPTRK